MEIANTFAFASIFFNALKICIHLPSFYDLQLFSLSLNIHTSPISDASLKNILIQIQKNVEWKKAVEFKIAKIPLSSKSACLLINDASKYLTSSIYIKHFYFDFFTANKNSFNSNLECFQYLVSTLMRHGLFLCTPYTEKITFSTEKEMAILNAAKDAPMIIIFIKESKKSLIFRHFYLSNYNNQIYSPVSSNSSNSSI